MTFFVLARILPLGSLGLFSAAVSIVAFAELFAENGLGDAVVQAADIDDRTLSAALIVNVGIGLVCAAVLALAASSLERLFVTPGLSAVLSVVALAIVMNAFTYIPQSLLRRRLEFRWLAIRALTATGLSGAIGIGLAFAGYGVTALIVQFLIASAMNLLFVWLVKPFRLQLVSPLAAWPLVRFGSRVFGTKLLDYLSSRSIELVILASLGAASLALYVLASRLWAVLMQLISAVTVDVSLPHFARLAGDREALLAAFYAAVRVTFAIGVPIFVLLAALAPEVMPVIFGDNGKGGASLLTPLALLGAMQIVQFYNGTLFTAVGRPDVTLLILIIRAVVIAAMLAFTWGQPLHAVVLGFALAQIAMTPVSFLMGQRFVQYSLAKLFALAMPYMVGSGGMFALIWFSRPLLEQSIASPLLRGVALGAVGVLCYVAVVLALDRAGAATMLRSVLGKSAKEGIV